MNIAKDNFEKEYQKKSSDDNRLFRTEYLVTISLIHIHAYTYITEFEKNLNINY